MTDQELLQAIGQVVEHKMSRLESKIDRLESKVEQLGVKVDQLETRVDALETQMTSVRVYIDVELKQTLTLLLEGQQALWNRFVSHEEFESLEDRTEILELTVKRHSQEIRELRFA